MGAVQHSPAKLFYDEGQTLALASGSDIAPTLNQILNRNLGWPFKALTGYAIDSLGQRSASIGTLIYTALSGNSLLQTGEIPADLLACAVDVCESLDISSFQAAYERIAQVKRLKKTKAPETGGVPHTTVTLGVIFAAQSTAPIETLAEELDRLNRATPSAQWPDMVVVQSKGTINYGAQFPGEGVTGDFLPPAEGAISSGGPPIYVVIMMKPTGEHTFNRMCAFIIAHLAIFSPGAALPKWPEILADTPKTTLTLTGYQFNLRGDLLPVPRHLYNDRYFPPLPLRIEDPKGNLLSTIQFLPWQDGGVVLLRGKLPLEGLLVFLGKKALTSKVTRGDLQMSYAIPITARDFDLLLQRIQTQSNLIVRNDTSKFTVQKFADEGSSSPFIARIFMGMLRLRDAVFPDAANRQDFDKAYEFVMMTLFSTRSTAKDIAKLYEEHARKVANGEVARVVGQTIHIGENIDKELRKQTEDFLNSAVRVLKQGMQDVTKALQVNIGFLFKKPSTFASGLTAMQAGNPKLADYLSDSRQWSERLVGCRNDLEHTTSVLPKIQYSQARGSIQAHEPKISGQSVSEFAEFMMDRLACFVEEVTAHCLQKHLPAGLSLREVPLALRPAEIPERFQITLRDGGTSVWELAYHQSRFDDT